MIVIGLLKNEDECYFAILQALYWTNYATLAFYSYHSSWVHSYDIFVLGMHMFLHIAHNDSFVNIANAVKVINDFLTLLLT